MKNMSHSSLFLSLFAVLMVLATYSPRSLAQEPKVGRNAAAKYFQKEQEVRSRSTDSLLMLHIGGYSSSTSYQWKDNDKRTGVGKASYGVTYLYDQWGSLDMNLRFDFNEYKIDEDRATKLSILPLFTFPMADRHFPLYFGFGAGPGVYFTQLADESNISLDYQLILGARLLDLVENFGFFIEYGMKNHLHVLSDGQFNGTALTTGAVFTF